MQEPVLNYLYQPLVNKLVVINETVLSVAQPLRKRNKNMAEAQGEKVGDPEPSKHAKVEQGRLNFVATNAVPKEQPSALLQNLDVNNEHDKRLLDLFSTFVSSIRTTTNIGTKFEHSSCTGVSNKDASISPSNSEDVDKYRRVIVHSNSLEYNTNSIATNQKYVEKKPCKKLESPVRKLMIENDVEEISTKVEQREKTCGELPDLNLPVYLVQSEQHNDKYMINDAYIQASDGIPSFTFYLTQL
ncbi:Wound-responsive family protein isoform 4 [Gossypium australe]|uniref:Wound-responsive family protein isoform 4 n=1 Tax=Gossypium australe TaxID=47621 RepID=A0A5B6WZT2_9ROSI|nr:Wound-responsive family protein isoform 4 [Gossypium australe]